MSIKRNKNQLIISILVGVAIFAISYQFVVKQYDENIKQKAEIQRLKSGIGIDLASSRAETTVYVVTKRELEKGEIISAEDVETKDVGVHIKNALTSTDKIIGKPTLKALKEGVPVTTSCVDVPLEDDIPLTSSDEPKSGYRAVAASMSANKMAPFIKSNTYVDVYTADNTIQAKNVRIIKVMEQEGKNSGKLVLFEIKDEDVGAFINAMTKDKLIPVQRSPHDKSGYEFTFDPFKYSEYTISNEDLSELSLTDEIPQRTAGKTSASRIRSAGRASVRSEYNIAGPSSVEVITGNQIQVMDF